MAPRALAEARQVETFAPASLPELGFDHAQIVADATQLQQG